MLVLSLVQGSNGEQRMKRRVSISCADFSQIKWWLSDVKSWYKWTNHLHTINIQDDGIYHVHVWGMYMTKWRVGCKVYRWRCLHMKGFEVPMEIFGKLPKKEWKQVYIYIHIFIYISFLGGYLVHQISHWQLSAFNVFGSQKQSLVLTNTNTK